jgi:hypothetical protein
MDIQMVKHTPIGLHTLRQVELNPLSRARLEAALADCGGDPTWQARKRAEAHELLALAQVAPARLAIHYLDLAASFRTMIQLQVPVPCLPPGGELEIQPTALLGIDYPREAMSRPSPGYGFVTILEPRELWHANVRLPEQVLCLGPTMPAGIRLRSLIWLSYAALAMTTTQTNPADTAGVMNAAAAEWWNQNLQRVPLSRDPFLAPNLPQE